MVTADQLFAHAVGDYLLQSHWMATTKTSSHAAAAAHVATYILPFLPLRPSARGLALLAGSHFLIDRYRLARFVCWAKNGARGPVTATGYPDDVPPWLATWLLIISDNILHVAINTVALRRGAP